MTDRIKALTVVLEKDVREDDIQPLIDAIELLQGVGCVKKHVSDITDAVAFNRARLQLEKLIWEAFRTQAKREEF